MRPRPAGEIISPVSLERQVRPADFWRMKTVVIIGASGHRDKWGNKAVRAFAQQGCRVHPVNPTEPEVEGLKAHPSIKDVPVRPETITAYIPPQHRVKILPDIAARDNGHWEEL